MTFILAAFHLGLPAEPLCVYAGSAGSTKCSQANNNVVSYTCVTNTVTSLRFFPAVASLNV